MTTTPQLSPTIESLLRVVEARDAEVTLLKLIVERLKLQLMRRTRAQFGASSERLDDAQMTLVEGQPLDEQRARKVPAKPEAANAPELDRSLPAHLPRDAQTYRPQTSDAHHDASGQACVLLAFAGTTSAQTVGLGVGAASNAFAQAAYRFAVLADKQAGGCARLCR